MRYKWINFVNNKDAPLPDERQQVIIAHGCRPFRTYCYNMSVFERGAFNQSNGAYGATQLYPPHRENVYNDNRVIAWCAFKEFDIDAEISE